MPLGELIAGILARWRGVSLAAMALFAAGVTTVMAWPTSYVADAVVAPAETTGIATSSLLSHAMPLGGLLDFRATGNFAIYIGAMRSSQAAELLAAETPILAELTAWRTAWPMGEIRQALGLRIEADLDDLRAWLERSLSITQTPNQVTWTIALAHRDRDAALAYLRRLHAFAEGKVRGDLEELARRRVRALEARLNRQTDAAIRQALYDLLAQSQRAGVIAAADDVVAARLVSGPSVGLRPSLPNRPLLILLLAIAAPMAALGIGTAAVLLGEARRPARRLVPEPAE
ncbi:hypothetical protein [Falsiroseomonas sp. HW251]|uniref:hypothetical protein n=1 Tax=Falsiroseomonas sp. HW251 TaxID=3390998 RepID=UPI003D31EFFD